MGVVSNWRDHIDVHPAAELDPMMSDAELQALGKDIKKRGMINPVVIWRETEQLIDGRSRLEAATRAGLLETDEQGRLCLRTWDGLREIKMTSKAGAGNLYEIDPFSLVDSLNLHRRHLTPEQKTERIANKLKAQPDFSNRQIAEMTGTSHPTVAKVRRKLEQSGDVEKVSTSTDTKGRQQPVHKSKTVSVKAPPPPTPAQRVEERIRKAGIADKKKHGELSLAHVIKEVVSAADREELIALASHPAWERHALARLECEKQGIDWKPASSAEQTAAERKVLSASDDTRGVPISDIRSVDPIQEPCENCATVAEHWQRSAENLAGDAISMRPYWTRQFGEWEKFDVPTSLMTLAKEAAKEWAQLACDLEKRQVGRT
jgi:DNA-binding Lrp family transcriptional regulator